MVTKKDADIVRDEASGPTRCRLRFSLRNVGGAEASDPETQLSLASAGVAVGILITPLIASISEDSMYAVPQLSDHCRDLAAERKLSPTVGFYLDSGIGGVPLDGFCRNANLEKHGLLEEPSSYMPRPDVFVIATADDAAQQRFRPLVAELRRAGLHVRHSYKATKNIGKLPAARSS